MRFERPEEPNGRKEEARLEAEKIAHAFRTGGALFFKESLWQEYKYFFAKAQYSKCAFCEMSIANHDSAIDHFAPKGEVWELSASKGEHGYEARDNVPNIEGRKAARKADTGYWWLAYEWHNFLVVCSACNTKWKRCFFPVKATPRQWPPSPEVAEEPLLLNPFDDPAPWRHFRFDESGHMAAAPDSIRGQATIETLGLDALSDSESRRAVLQGHRSEIAADAHRWARAFAGYSFAGSEELAGYMLENLYRLGGIRRDHAGMVRAIAEHVTGFTWDELMIFRSLDGGAPAASPGISS